MAFAPFFPVVLRDQLRLVTTLVVIEEKLAALHQQGWEVRISADQVLVGALFGENIAHDFIGDVERVQEHRFAHPCQPGVHGQEVVVGQRAAIGQRSRFYDVHGTDVIADEFVLLGWRHFQEIGQQLLAQLFRYSENAVHEARSAAVWLDHARSVLCFGSFTVWQLF
uniref:(northern house mosquito) hypothetical protein n=1 Tax=Culex pipiens TaxID=7175 RepID=A0A8D8BSX7_CULPI